MKAYITIDITHKINGCLEQGGWIGRKVLIRRKSIGMPNNASLTDITDDHGTTWRDIAYDYARSTDWRGDRVLVKGCIIN